jgi:hypothetical protein
MLEEGRRYIELENILGQSVLQEPDLNTKPVVTKPILYYFPLSIF